MMGNKTTLKIATVILAWASFLHFTNFILGGVIAIMGFTIPVYFSLLLSLILAFMTYRLRKITAL